MKMNITKNNLAIKPTKTNKTLKITAEDALIESENKYKTLAETANDYIFIIDTNEIVQYVNYYASKQIGLKPNNIINKELKQIFPKDLYERQIKNIKKVIKTKKPFLIETESMFLNKNIWLSTSLSPIFDKNGNVKSVLGISRDISVYKNTEKALIESEEKYRKIIEHAADGILIGTINGNFIDANTKACELTGYSKTDLLKMNMSQLFSKKELSNKPFSCDLLLTEQTVVAERVLLRKDKSFIDIEMITKRITENSFQSIFRNITERKKSEELLLKYQVELETLVKKRTQELEKANIKLKKENEERLYTEDLLRLRLREKVILLKEVHHRVKNNMQVIISLLNLQAANIKDSKMLEIYQESQNRIKSMALIHEKLYHSEELTHVNFSDYCKKEMSCVLQFLIMVMVFRTKLILGILVLLVCNWFVHLQNKLTERLHILTQKVLHLK